MIILGLLMSALFLAQTGSVFSAMELRGVVARRDYEYVDAISYVENYKSDYSARRRWDALQTEFSCCGVLSFNEGYKIWRNADIGLQDNSVPDSCCLTPSEGCGRNVFRESEATIYRDIHTHGCLAVLGPKLHHHVVPVLLGYSGVGALLAVAQMLAAVFAFVHAAQLARREKEKAMGGEFRHAAHISVPSSPHFDHRSHFMGKDNLSQAFDDADCSSSAVYGNLSLVRASSPAMSSSQLREREV